MFHECLQTIYVLFACYLRAILRAIYRLLHIDFSYRAGYAKSQIDEPLPFFSMERESKRAIELLTWIQKAIPKTFPFLLKGENGYVKVYPLNRFLIPHDITSYQLRKFGADHASRVHGGKNDSCRQRIEI